MWKDVEGLTWVAKDSTGIEEWIGCIGRLRDIWIYLEGLGRVPSRDWQLLEVFMEDLSRVLGLHSCMVPEGCIG